MVDFWDEIAAVERRMDEIVRGFLGTRTSLARPTFALALQKPFVPTMDIFERTDDLVVKLEIPGIDPGKDVTVVVQDGAVIITGERRQEKEVDEEAYHRMEVSYGAFERSIVIPEGVDEDKISATYVDGVLEVVLPNGASKEVTEPVEARTIPVTTEKRAVKAA
jgi:HSP20 family molecular chaperone IbpA